MLSKPLNDSGKDARSIWRSVSGKIQYNNNLPIVNMGLLRDFWFYIKKMDKLCKRQECRIYKQIFTRDKNLINILKEGRCTGGETKIIFSGDKLKHILNSSEKVFYCSNKKIYLLYMSMD